MDIKYGIDLSKHNGVVDLEQAKASGVSFVILRAGYGKDIKQKDPYFELNYRQAKRLGLNVGAYWYCYAETATGAREEAKACLEAISGKTFDLPIYYDVEEKRVIEHDPSTLEGIINEFCNYLENRYYFVGLYMSKSYLEHKIPMRTLTKYAVWVAQWPKGDNKPKLTYTLTRPGMWQYSSNGSVPGISGRVDLDQMLIDYPTIIKSAKLNGYNDIFNLSEMEQAIQNEEALEILYKCRDDLYKLRERYM